jgi:asparagine synthase (glutamine-hydrolysing)
MIINLNREYSTVSKNEQTLYYSGFFFDHNETLYNDFSIIDLLSDNNIPELLKQLNGNFFLILDSDAEIFFCVDHIRSKPLFYALDKDNELILSDDALFIKENLHLKDLNYPALHEFLLSGFVSNKDTLIEGIFQLQAGEYAVYNKLSKQFSIQSYFKYQHADHEPKQEIPAELLHKTHQNIFKRLIGTLENRTVVIPLSGGYDSRLVAVMLKELGYKNVICFSYGKKNNRESLVSKSVADFLGFKWIFVEHSRRSWFEGYNSELRKDFYRYACHLSCNAHIQDFLAVYELKTQKLIPDDSIFIPGHSADFLEGSHIPELFNKETSFQSSQLLDSLKRFHYYYWTKPDKATENYIDAKITEKLKPAQTLSQEDITSYYEQWDWQERQSKFICNAVRVYEYFGFDWRLPLWDKELMAFWSEIPFRHRYKRNLYYQYVKEYQKIPVLQANKKISLPQRIVNKIIRICLGDIKEIRYGRYADPSRILSFRNAKIRSYLNPKLKYPDFVKPDQSIFDTPINAIHALICIKELTESDK